MLAVLFQNIFDFYVRSVVLYKKIYQKEEEMEYNHRILKLKDGRSTIFKFSKSELGKCFSEDQINDIFELVKEYLLRFPNLQIYLVTDYGNDKYLPSKKDEHYNGQIFYREKMIILNQVTLAETLFDDKELIKHAEKLATQSFDLLKEMKDISPKLRKYGVPEVKINEYKCKIMTNMKWEENELNGKTFDKIFADSCAIRVFESVKCIKRVLIHEIAHAIAREYLLLQHTFLQQIFAMYKEQFENIDEFFAECFMTSELTKVVPIANLVGSFANTKCKSKNI